MTSDAACTPDWVSGTGLDADVVISTRARLARSLADFPFPSRATGEDLTMVAREVREAAAQLTGKFPEIRAISVEKLGGAEKAFLLDSHIASVEQLRGGHGRLVVLEPGATLSILVNEEDHLRIQALMSGLVPDRAWQMVDWADDVLAQRLNYGFSERYGYLTASVSNLGTGLRISAMLHLAGLALKRKLGAQLRAAYDLGVSVRGMFGEASRSAGDLFQVSNEVTLGISEKEIVQRVSSVARYILEEERLARTELLQTHRKSLIDRAVQSLSKLQAVRTIAPREAITLLSPIRLAAEVGIIEDCPRSLFNELLMGMRVGAGQDHAAGLDRADLLRSTLAELDIEPG